MDFKGKKVMVVGMAKSGIASAGLLIAHGADVTLYDAKPLENFEPGAFDAFEGKAAFAFGADADALAQQMDALVLSPGVPPALPFIQNAVRAGKKVIGEIELGALYTQAEFVAISGTNGKTTTTALTGEVFKNGGYTTHVLGNIGIPIAGEVDKTRKGDVIVAETAALQLETIDTFRPRVSAILNITEDHLDRYGNMENYIAAKERVFENQSEEDYCVLNYDNDVTRGMAGRQKSQVIWFSRQVRLERGVYLEDGNIVSAEPEGRITICRADEVKIPGTHNLENALAAAAMARCYGISAQAIRETLMTFAGVEHRIEFVREVNGVRYINDSKGTNADATEKAAAAMTRPTVIILGGYDKKSGFEELIRGFGPHIRAIVALGDTRQRVVDDAAKAGFAPVHIADSFDNAVVRAREIAQPGWNVLLSPACASYDMFKDFEQRGRAFKRLVGRF